MRYLSKDVCILIVMDPNRPVNNSTCVILGSAFVTSVHNDVILIFS